MKISLNIKLFISILLFLFSGCNNQNNTNINGINSYILYGSPDTSQSHQAIVYIVTDQGGGYVAACTGTVISRDVVLTAAHCIGPKNDMTVYFGNSQTGFWDSRGVSDTHIHPGYSGTSGTSDPNDIAMIRLNSNVASSIVPIPPLPSSIGINQNDMNSTPLQYVGFGQTETGSSGTKLTITRPAVALCDGPSDCQFNLSGVGYVQLPPGAFGIRMDSSQGGICHGDSGGPALVIRNNTEYVAGVSAWVLQDSNENCAYFGASTKVDYFETFINAYLGTSAEICTNGIDDDDDNMTDCDDPDCVSHPNCLEHSCDNPVDLYCGDSISGTTVNSDSFYSDYSSCSSGAPENGSEKAYRLNISSGSNVILSLTPSSSSSNLDLFLTGSGCTPDNCISSSINPTGMVEQIQFTQDSNPKFAIVETYNSEGAFTLSVNCDNSNPFENCSNGIDDDGDGRIDCADTDCFNTTSCSSSSDENCSNGVDDDHDTLIDCDDADCHNTSYCLSRIENCTNYIDDDGDLKADCDDIDCALSSICHLDTEICNNGIDDDGNGKSDCNDPNCITSQYCKVLSEICNNGVDDDGDGKIDCLDADCHSFSSCPVPSGEICYNSYDDDGDGLGDCDDPDCNSYYLCTLVNSYNTGGTSPGGCSCNSVGNSGTLPSMTLIILLFGIFIIRRSSL